MKRREHSKANNDIYTLIRNMELNVEKLFESLGIEEVNHSSRTPNMIAYMIQNMTADKSVLRNLEAINSNLNKAIQKHEAQRLDAWSIQEGALSLDKENVSLLEKVQAQQEEIERLKEALEKQSEENKVFAASLNELQRSNDQCKESLKNSQDRSDQFINSFISLRDSILLKEGLCSGKEDEVSVQLHKLLSLLLKETYSLAEKNDMEVIDLKGLYNSDLQVVTDIIPTDKKELQDTVAETFRPGYRYKDKLIRPQEVILYSYTFEKDN